MPVLINSFQLQAVGGGSSTLPPHSMDFEQSSSQYLSMSDANFGSYDRAKFAISVWVLLESTGTQRRIYCQDDSLSQRGFSLFFSNTDRLDFSISQNGSTSAQGRLSTTATYTSTSSWYHILAHYDSANATANDRMRLWVNGTEVTSFSTRTNPTAQIHDSTANVTIGSTAVPSQYFDGLIYQPAFFSGTLPAIGDVYDAGAPKDITGLSGLHSLLNTNATDALEDDYVLSANWTNNNTVIKSTTVP